MLVFQLVAVLGVVVAEGVGAEEEGFAGPVDLGDAGGDGGLELFVPLFDWLKDESG